MIEIVFALGLFILAVTFVIEAYTYRRYKQEIETWELMIESYIESFIEVKTVINNNSNTLREATIYVNKHERLIQAMGILLDLHSEALKINPKIREELEETHLNTDAVLDFRNT